MNTNSIKPFYRYNDIICIDATRVVLKGRPPEDDYINASWMTMPDGQKYICTQACLLRYLTIKGPLLEFVGDFWHMVTSEKSNVIVMLCNFNEGKHEKCCFYLPKEKRDIGYFGEFKVAVKEIKPDPYDGIKHTVLEVKWERRNLKLEFQEGALPRDTTFNDYLDSYVSMIKRYNKRVEQKEKEREKTEA
ncbi:Protein-tyrosine phosphatase [Ostertagia ostertagi]